jgi:hypothetical protein
LTQALFKFFFSLVIPLSVLSLKLFSGKQRKKVPQMLFPSTLHIIRGCERIHAENEHKLIEYQVSLLIILIIYRPIMRSERKYYPRCVLSILIVCFVCFSFAEGPHTARSNWKRYQQLPVQGQEPGELKVLGDWHGNLICIFNFPFSSSSTAGIT